MMRNRCAYRIPLIGLVLTALLLASLALGNSGVTGQASAEDPAPRLLLPAVIDARVEKAGTGDEFVPGQIAVGLYQDRVSAADFADQIEANLIEPLEMAGARDTVDNAAFEGEIEAYLIRVPLGEELQAIERALENPAVAFAQPNWYVRAADTGDTTFAAETPFAVNDPLYESDQWYMQRIFASRAWALSGSVRAADAQSDIVGNSGRLSAEAALPIEVVVIDSGVDHTHADLTANISLSGRNYIDSSQLPIDDCGHGTHVAGLIAAEINNGLGIAGGAADVTVIPFKALSWSADDRGCIGPVSNVVNAIRDATDNGADIINLSLELDQDFAPLEAAVNYARSHGVLVIGAAGNCLSWPYDCAVKYPARYGAVMAVASTGYFNTPAFYSPRGAEIDIAAPGGDATHSLMSTWPSALARRCAGYFRLMEGGGYCAEFGTSMAAGVATGAAALIWSVRPQYTAEDVRDILEESVQPLPDDEDKVGDGLVDAYRGVRYALRSRLEVTPRQINLSLPFGSPPEETGLLFENPSLEPISWLITGTSRIKWLDPVEPVSGTVHYGEPIRAPLVISATHQPTGTYRNTFTVEAERVDGSRIVIPITAHLKVFTPTSRLSTYFPMLGIDRYQQMERPYVPFSWEWPDELGRTELPLLMNSSTGVTLPVTVTMDSQIYTDVRVYSDGHVVVPASGRVSRATNVCLPVANVEGLAIFGWWADLDPVRSGGRISIFRAGGDRSVIEFSNVFVPGAKDDDRVSFQLVIHENGEVGMNYRAVPSTTSALEPPLQVTVGVQRNYGRFFNEIACVTDELEVGVIPRAFQSLLFRRKDLF